MGEVVDIRTGEQFSPIAFLMQQVWPANRTNGDFRDILRAQAEAEPRRVICGFCGKRSRMLDGPAGRAWFASHTASGGCSQKVVA